jgi:hypothetical protein
VAQLLKEQRELTKVRKLKRLWSLAVNHKAVCAILLLFLLMVGCGVYFVVNLNRDNQDRVLLPSQTPFIQEKQNTALYTSLRIFNMNNRAVTFVNTLGKEMTFNLTDTTKYEKLAISTKSGNGVPEVGQKADLKLDLSIMQIEVNLNNEIIKISYLSR